MLYAKDVCVKRSSNPPLMSTQVSAFNEKVCHSDLPAAIDITQSVNVEDADSSFSVSFGQPPFCGRAANKGQRPPTPRHGARSPADSNEQTSASFGSGRSPGRDTIAWSGRSESMIQKSSPAAHMRHIVAAGLLYLGGWATICCSAALHIADSCQIDGSFLLKPTAH